MKEKPCRARTRYSQLICAALASMVLGSGVCSSAPALAQAGSPEVAPESGGLKALVELLNSMPDVYFDDLIELRSDSEPADAHRLAEQLKGIFSYALKLQNLEGNAACRKPLIVGLASQELIKKYIHTKLGARALGSMGFVSHSGGYLSDSRAYDWYAAAHEFEHVLMARLKATQPALPTYLVEGIACAVGTHYVRSSGLGTAALTMQSRKLALVSAAEARQTFLTFATAADVATTRSAGRLFVAEHIGGLFIEYLATRKASTPEAFFRKWAKFAAELGAGARLEPCFAKNLGISLPEAQSEFFNYMRATEGDPKKRFSGTVYEGYL